MNIKFYGKSDENVYLDNGASTLALQSVVDAGMDFLSTYGSVHRGSGLNSERSTETYEACRDNILSQIDGNTNEHAVIFTANTTDGINKFSLIYPFDADDKVLTSDIEHSSNLLPWSKQAEIITFPTPGFKIVPEIVERYIKSDFHIKILALTAASNITGYLTPVEEIYKICQKYGVIFFLDASQYAPHFKPSLKYCDVLVYCGHKMYAPFGAGVLAGRKDLFRHDTHSLTGGGNVVYANSGYSLYKDVPHMHESGTPNGIGCVTLAKAHDVLYNQIGPDTLAQHTCSLVSAISAQAGRLREAGYNIYFADNILKTPVLIIDNTRKDNATTAQLLSHPLDGYEKSVFCREGAFCAYTLIERLKGITPLSVNQPGGGNVLKYGSITSDDYSLPRDYSLIRLSAGLINTPDDIAYAADKLIVINNL